jgi:hypothetical protein
MSATVSWPASYTMRSPVAGIVTRFDIQSHPAAGSPLLWVDEVPLTFAVGAIPMYRDLAVGAKGWDVVQLEALLSHLGFLPPDREPEGVFGSKVRQAVVVWENSQGRAASSDGAVGVSELVFLPVIPGRVVFGAVRRGETIEVGDVLFKATNNEPTFTLKIGTDTARDVAAGQSVRILPPASEAIAGTVGKLIPDAETTLFASTLSLSSECRERCSGMEEGQLLTAEVDVIPVTTGQSLPLWAIRDAPSGGSEVVLQSGKAVPVKVVVVDHGVAVVTGVAEGSIVLLPRVTTGSADA